MVEFFGGKMIFKFGFYIFIFGLLIAVFTSNLIISDKEKNLMMRFKAERRSGSVVNAGCRYAYVNILIARVTRVLMAFGFVLMIIGYFFY